MWFEFLALKYMKVLLLKNSLVPNKDFIFLKYFFNDPTVRMLMYTHFSDGKKIYKNSDIFVLLFNLKVCENITS